MRSQQGAIVCRSLTKAYDGRTVVDDVSFEVAAGTITGFVGANGAGKTTTMRMLLGLVAPTSGIALVDGRPYRELASPRRRVGAVVDGPGAHPGHSARLHLSVLATASGLPGRRVDEVLDLVELTEHAGRRVGGFSMGMLQRLAIAGALLGDPGVLILDEPANGLDPPGILWMRDLLRGLAADGRALLVSSHLLAELAEVADRVLIIDRGRLLADEPLDQLLDGTRVVEMRCADAAAMLRAVTARDLRADLEDDFLVIHGMSAREAGELAVAQGAGPVHWLTERTSTFEEVYFRLAGPQVDPREAS
ncbi:ABC transporter ATP-binding protein [Actinomadura monticuli]|uniref:ATP-binding cassette domain-containing protein n=1 Tax=Actinomadura monticuli TaxID=3097367 RepID=A0ABV4QA13_9ACTN